MSRSAPPRVVRRTTVFKGRVFRVDRERVRMHRGRTAVLEIVRHRGSVVLIPQPKRGSVILIRQYRHAIRRWIWELPAGSLEAGEPLRTAAIRECQEEIGLRPGRVRRLTALYPTPGFCDEKMTFYLCDRLGPVRGHVEQDEDEQLEPRTFTLAEAKRLVARGQILDMKTVLGLSLLEPRRP